MLVYFHRSFTTMPSCHVLPAPSLNGWTNLFFNTHPSQQTMTLFLTLLPTIFVGSANCGRKIGAGALSACDIVVIELQRQTRSTIRLIHDVGWYPTPQIDNDGCQLEPSAINNLITIIVGSNHPFQDSASCVLTCPKMAFRKG
jgi:hypothetical protein